MHSINLENKKTNNMVLKTDTNIPNKQDSNAINSFFNQDYNQTPSSFFSLSEVSYPPNPEEQKLKSKKKKRRKL